MLFLYSLEKIKALSRSTKTAERTRVPVVRSLAVFPDLKGIIFLETMEHHQTL